MQIRIAGKQIDIGEGLPERVRTKLASAVGKHFSRDSEANVIFAKERVGFRADCTVHLSSGSRMQAHGTGDNASQAFDMAVERLEKQVRRYMRRLKNHHDHGSQARSEVE